MDIEVTQGPSFALFGPAELKENVRVSHSLEDAMIERIIGAATTHIEEANGISIRDRRLKLWLCGFPAYIELPAPPLRYVLANGAKSAIVSVQYQDSSNVTQTLSANSYVVWRADQVWRIALNAGVAIPVTFDTPRAVSIEFDVGYADAKNVPMDIVQAVMLMASHYYQNREDTYSDSRVMNVEKRIAHGVDALMAKYRVVKRMALS